MLSSKDSELVGTNGISLLLKVVPYELIVESIVEEENTKVVKETRCDLNRCRLPAANKIMIMKPCLKVPFADPLEARTTPRSIDCI